MGPSTEAGTVSDQVRLQGEHVACLSLFTEPSEPLPEEPKLEGMAFHHCHKDPMPQSGLSPERVQARRQLYAACAVCFIFMAGEVVGKLGDTPPSPTFCTSSATLHQESLVSWVEKQGRERQRRVGRVGH